jgi:hypothetical protein
MKSTHMLSRVDWCGTRHARVGLLEGIVANLQSGSKIMFVYCVGKVVRGCVSGRRRAGVRKADNIFLNTPLSRDTGLHSFDSGRVPLRRGISDPRHRLCNVSIRSSPVVVAHSDVPLRSCLSGFGCLLPPFHGGGPVLRNAPATDGVDETAPCLRSRETLLCGQPQCLRPSCCNHDIVCRRTLQCIQPRRTQEMELSQLGLAACVSPVRGFHGGLPPGQEGVFDERDRGVAAVLACPWKQSAKHPRPRRWLLYERGVAGGNKVKVLEREGPLHSNPNKYLNGSCSLVARKRETDLLSPACEKLPRSGRCSVSRDLRVALRVRRRYAARHESARVCVCES